MIYLLQISPANVNILGKLNELHRRNFKLQAAHSFSSDLIDTFD